MKRQKAIEQELVCESIRINPHEEDWYFYSNQ